MADQVVGIGQLFTTSFLSAGVAAVIVGAFVKTYLDKRLEAFRAQRSHDLVALTDLVAPTVMLLARTEAVSLRYSKSDNQCYGDAAILSDSNRRLRKLLLDKAYLMPGNLVGPSQDLVAHCDIWLRRFDSRLEKYKRENGGNEPDFDGKFDVGFAWETKGAGKCGDFPREVPQLYQKTMERLQASLLKGGRADTNFFNSF